MRFKKGDRVIAHRPENARDRYVSPMWTDGMDAYDGRELIVESTIDEEFIRVKGTAFVFNAKWLSYAVEETPYSKVIRKIKRMESKRKEMGYAF